MADVPLILSFDLGTSSVKAALFDVSGQRLGSAVEPLALHLPQPGWAQQHPEDWWQALGKASRRTVAEAGVSPERIGVVGLSAQTCAMIPLDQTGEVLHPAMIWLDARSQGEAKRITAGGPRIKGYGLVPLLRWLWLTNGAPNLGGKDTPSKMVWFRENHPDLWQRTYKMLDAKDELLRRCTGLYRTTPDCAHLTWMMDSRTDRWSPSLMAHLGMEEEKLPKVIPSTSVAGGLTADAAHTLGVPVGIPVAGGLSDLSAAALGSGAYGLGETHLYLGTSGWFGAHHPRRWLDPRSGVATLRGAGEQDEPSRYLLLAVQEMTAGALSWAAKTLFDTEEMGDKGEPLEALLTAAARSPAGANGVLFLPWLAGERCPVDDAQRRGGFIHLGLEHNRDDMARAVLEGVGFNLRWALQAFQRSSGVSTGAIHVLGGGARSELWMQILAAILERPLLRVQAPEWGGTCGAAICAAVAAGNYANLEQATQAMVIIEKRFNPDLEQSALYRQRFQALLPLYFKSSETVSNGSDFRPAIQDR
ncbi:MAG: FGGY-family carbohydrate kinase [Magnetococcales bacterium]|nr:FGGY-family carbohydrate kinase [Magnetococcales bacterium]